MPEIWLNYGLVDVVLDIRAENLEQKIDSEGETLDDSAINERLGQIDLSKPVELVVLHSSRSIHKIITLLFMMCEQKSKPFPKILAEKKIIKQLRANLPEGAAVDEFGSAEIPDSNLVFMAEMEFDGLFGYETVSTRLIKKFGQESMLDAYAKRQGNLPVPGQHTESLEESKRFSSNFEIQCIELVANSQGIVDFSIGHPSETLSIAKTLESNSIRDAGQHGAMILSTGKNASNDTLGRSLSSLWNCSNAIKKDGLAVLLAECKDGLGSDAVRHFIEGRLALEQLRNPTKYVSGMEDLLFLSEVQKNFQIGLVSILPELYTKKLGMISLSGTKPSLDYVLKTRGARQKVAVVIDGARLLLR